MLSQLIHPYRRVEETTANPPTMADYFPPQPEDGRATNFQPSLTVVLGVLAVMFSLTFALLLYAKCCQRDSHAPPPPGRRRLRSSIFSSPSEAAAAGLTKQAIESLPLIGFGSLGGSKEGLECAVCLSRYQDADILRLLPKCSHAFHVHCVDQWLESNSTCPLCRSQVAADDASLILSTSSRFVQSAQDSNDSNEGVDLLVEREEEEEGDLDASIFSIRSSFRKLFVAGAGSARDKALDKHKHKIIISDVVLKNRWSNVSYSDLMSLESEMMLSGDRFSVSGSWNRERSLGCSDCAAVVEGRRSVSEITLFSRLGWRKGRECPLTGAGEEEDKKRKIWLPIARKTVEWFASREKTQHSRYIIDDTV